MDEFSRYAIRVSIAQVCQTLGWTKIQNTPLEVLTDFMQEYIIGLGKLANNFAMIMGQSEPNLTHVALAFREMGISFDELKEYISFFDSGSVLKVPRYPIRKESHLNHLKPGSREVLTRPVHIHEHLPPMYPFLENGEVTSAKSPTHNQSFDNSSPPHAMEMDLSDTEIKAETDEEIMPLRELSSVLMTTSGFLSSAREGKLPEVRTSSDIPSSPAPEAKDDEKKKKFFESLQKIDKENRKKKKKIEDKGKIKQKKSKKEKKKRREKEGKRKDRQDSTVSFQTTSAVPFHDENNTSLKTDTLQIGMNEESKNVPEPSDLRDCTNQNMDSFHQNDLNSTGYQEHVDVQERIGHSSVDLFSVPSVQNPDFDYENEIIDVMTCTTHLKKSSPSRLNEIESIDHSLDLDESISFMPVVKSPVFDLKQSSDCPVIFNSPQRAQIFEQPIDKVESSQEPNGQNLNVTDYQEPMTDFGNIPNSNYGKHSHSMKKKKKEKKHKSKDKSSSKHRLKTKHKTSDEIKTMPTNNTDLWDRDAQLEEIPLNGNPFLEKSNIVENSLDKSSILSEDVIPANITENTTSSNEIETTNPNKSPNRIVLSAPVMEVPKKEKKLKVLYAFPQPHANMVQPQSREASPLPAISNQASLDNHKKEKKKDKKKKKKDLTEHLSENIFSFEPLKRVKTDEKPVSPVPKITFKLGASSPREPTEKSSPKILIKPVIKKDEDPETNIVSKKTNKGVTFHESVKPPAPENSFGPGFFPVKREDPWTSDPNQVWICPACSLPDNGSPMIACDKCDLWFHWICVGVSSEIAGNWYCKACVAKQEHEKYREKKKKSKKKKHHQS